MHFNYVLQVLKYEYFFVHYILCLISIGHMQIYTKDLKYNSVNWGNWGSWIFNFMGKAKNVKIKLFSILVYLICINKHFIVKLKFWIYLHIFFYGVTKKIKKKEKWTTSRIIIPKTMLCMENLNNRSIWMQYTEKLQQIDPTRRSRIQNGT